MAHSNLWEDGKNYSDGTSHFNRFTKASIQKFFGIRGAWSTVEGAPNWVQPVASETYGLEFQLVRLDDDGNLQKEFPLHLSIKPKAGVETFAPPDDGKGKGVASWNYRAEMDGIQLFSEDTVKNIICNSDGITYAIGCRMPAAGRNSFATHNQLNIGVPGGRIAVVPYVVLAFYMWVETPGESDAVLGYLKRIGWATNAA
jgi:hypothetical protein